MLQTVLNFLFQAVFLLFVFALGTVQCHSSGYENSTPNHVAFELLDLVCENKIWSGN